MGLLKQIKSQRLVRALVRNFRPGALILIYHRISECQGDPQLLCVRPQYFAEHLDYLRKYCRVIHLTELVHILKSRRLPRRTVVITFDDGYADNFHSAKAMLKEYNLPATIFVTAGYLKEKRGYWWDELEHILLATSRLPERLEIKIGGNVCSWELKAKANLHRPSDNWNVLMESNPSPGHEVYRDLSVILRGLGREAREQIIAEITAWAGASRFAPGDRRCLTDTELKLLIGDGLIEIGAHTMSHPALVYLPLDQQRAEIGDSKRVLERVCGRSVVSFAYPFGMRGDYSAETIRLVKEAGFTCACSNFWGLVYRKTDRYQLPRHVVRDWDGKRFSQRLEEWFRD